MNKLRVGIIVYPESNPLEGGGHSYYATLLNAINEHIFDDDIELINIVFYTKNIPRVTFKKRTIFIRGVYRYESGLKHRIKKLSTRYSFRYFFTRQNPIISFLLHYKISRRNREIEEVLRSNKIDLVYYLKHELNVLNYPFIATNWDLAHRSMDVFPETALDNNYEIRENYFLYTLNKALRIVCESEAGAKELLDYYNVYKPKVKVLPIFAGNIIHENVNSETQQKILNQYNLNKYGFFIYPAQFWSFKNHYQLVQAFKTLVGQQPNQNLKLVFTGSNMGNKDYIIKVIESLSLEAHVIVLDFVSNEELYTFYKNAIALTMPTFLGPTNMPLLEAAYLKCAVLCSNLEGHKEILGNHALYFDPAKSAEIAEMMKQVLNQERRTQLVENAFDHINQSPFTIQNSLRKLNEILSEAKQLRKTWGFDY